MYDILYYHHTRPRAEADSFVRFTFWSRGMVVCIQWDTIPGATID